jgi:hypothetical protein
MKGTIVSRRLTELRLKPAVGMQVMLLTRMVCKITRVTSTGVFLDYTEDSVREWGVWRLRVLMVIDEDDNALPLKDSDWQQAVDQELIDSEKEVEFEIGYGDGETFVFHPTYPHAFKQQIATLISQQNDVKKVYTEEEVEGICADWSLRLLEIRESKEFVTTSTESLFKDWWDRYKSEKEMKKSLGSSQQKQ